MFKKRMKIVIHDRCGSIFHPQTQFPFLGELNIVKSQTMFSNLQVLKQNCNEHLVCQSITLLLFMCVEPGWRGKLVKRLANIYTGESARKCTTLIMFISPSWCRQCLKMKSKKPCVDKRVV